MYGGPQQTDFVNTIVSLTGISHFKDLNGGTPNCVSITPLVRIILYWALSQNLLTNLPDVLSQSINWHDSDHRSSSVQAYLTPVESIRKNWLTLTQNFVNQLSISPCLRLY